MRGDWPPVWPKFVFLVSRFLPSLNGCERVVTIDVFENQKPGKGLILRD
jgi:hypothetical protein